MIYEYQCQKCQKIQEKWHKIAETNTEPCEVEECKAPPEELKRVLSPHPVHVSWSKWRV
jgi:putative FmdB family regulatory protein